MEYWIAQAFNGITLGMLLFLLAAGLSLTFGLMRIVNLAHGSFYLVGAYVGLTVSQLTHNFFVAALAGSLAVGLLGIVMQRTLLYRFYQQELAQVMVTFGFLFILADLSLWIWGGTPQNIPKPPMFVGSLSLGEIVLPAYRLLVIGLGVAVAIFLWWLQERTGVGANVRASVDDQETAGAMGVNVGRLMTLVFGLGAALAALSGVAAGALMTVFPGADLQVLLLAVVVVIVGGLGSLRGAFVGAVLIGLLDTFGKALFPELAQFTIFAPMVLILAIKPTGIFGRS